MMKTENTLSCQNQVMKPDVNGQFPGTFYRDNAAIVDISFLTWKRTEASELQLLRKIRSCRYIVIREADKEIVFDRSILGVPQHLFVCFKIAGDYVVNVQLVDGNGYANSFCKKLKVVGLQANFNMGVIDCNRWPQLPPAQPTLAKTREAYVRRSKKMNIAGMVNATLYRAFHRGTNDKPNLSVPAYDNTNFQIAKFNAMEPDADTKIASWLHQFYDKYEEDANLSLSSNPSVGLVGSDLLTCEKLNVISLANSDSMLLPQYGGKFLELQFDVDALEDKVFELSLTRFKFDKPHVMRIEFEDALDLCNKIIEFVEQLPDVKTPGDFAWFKEFTWSLKEVYVDEVDDVANPRNIKTSWMLCALSRTPLAWQAYQYAGSAANVMLFDTIEFTDNVASQAVIGLPTNVEADVDATEASTWQLDIDVFGQHFVIDAEVADDLTPLHDALQAFIVQQNLKMQVMKLQSNDNWQIEGRKLQKFVMFADAPMNVTCEQANFKLQHDVPRRSYDTLFEQIENGATTTVGCWIVAVPDEKRYAFQPCDIRWTVTFNPLDANAKPESHVSFKWLLKYHCQQIGNYDIQLVIIDPYTGDTIQRINKSVTVTKPQK